jgi:hypothetical protein
MRKCNICKIDYPMSHFFLKRGKPRTYCKTCSYATAKSYRARLKKDPSIKKKFETKEERQKRKLSKINQYGITELDKIKLLEIQKHRCAICEGHETIVRGGKTISLCIDHNHKTGKVRGLLCSNCNRGLGYFKDNMKSLLNAIRYIKRGKQSL